MSAESRGIDETLSGAINLTPVKRASDTIARELQVALESVASKDAIAVIVKAALNAELGGKSWVDGQLQNVVRDSVARAVRLAVEREHDTIAQQIRRAVSEARGPVQRAIAKAVEASIGDASVTVKATVMIVQRTGS